MERQLNAGSVLRGEFTRLTLGTTRFVLICMLGWFTTGLARSDVPCSFPLMQIILMSDRSDLATADLKMIEAWISEALSKTPRYFVVLERAHIPDILIEHRMSFEDFMEQSKSDPTLSNQLEGRQANYYLVFTANSSTTGKGWNFFLKLVNISKLVQEDIYTAPNISDSDLHLKYIPSFVNSIITRHFTSQVTIQTGKNKSRLEIVSTGDQLPPIKLSEDFNGTYTTTLPYGSYDISINLKNYRKQTRPLCLLSSNENINFTMAPRSGTIKLAGTVDTPQRVQILMDGKEVSQLLPYSREVSEGSHSIVIKKRGYTSWEKEVDVKDGDEFQAPDVRLLKKPIMTSMMLSTALPGLGEFNLGYRQKGIVLSSGYVVSVASTILTTMFYNDSWDIYEARKNFYESMTDGNFSKAKQNAIDGYQAARAWDTLRWTSVGAAGIIWGYSLLDTWMLANNAGESNLSLIPTVEGLTLAYSF